jgi:hypothetical protein
LVPFSSFVSELLTLLFANDTACLIAGPNIKEVTRKANLELQKIALWLGTSKMAVNVAKTKFVILKPKDVKLKRGHSHEKVVEIFSLCHRFGPN